MNLAEATEITVDGTVKEILGLDKDRNIPDDMLEQAKYVTDKINRLIKAKSTIDNTNLDMAEGCLAIIKDLLVSGGVPNMDACPSMLYPEAIQRLVALKIEEFKKSQ